jgi:hypothetical protein
MDTGVLLRVDTQAPQYTHVCLYTITSRTAVLMFLSLMSENVFVLH